MDFTSVVVGMQQIRELEALSKRYILTIAISLNNQTIISLSTEAFADSLFILVSLFTNVCGYWVAVQVHVFKLVIDEKKFEAVCFTEIDWFC